MRVTDRGDVGRWDWWKERVEKGQSVSYLYNDWCVVVVGENPPNWSRH